MKHEKGTYYVKNPTSELRNQNISQNLDKYYQIESNHENE